MVAYSYPSQTKKLGYRKVDLKEDFKTKDSANTTLGYEGAVKKTHCFSSRPNSTIGYEGTVKMPVGHMNSTLGYEGSVKMATGYSNSTLGYESQVNASSR